MDDCNRRVLSLSSWNCEVGEKLNLSDCERRERLLLGTAKTDEREWALLYLRQIISLIFAVVGHHVDEQAVSRFDLLIFNLLISTQECRIASFTLGT